MTEWDGQTTPHAAEGPQWVSAAEAADAAGVTPGTVRYWARNGLIVSEVAAGPAGERTLVRLDEVLRHAKQGSPGGAGGGAPGGRQEGVVTDLPARTSELAPILKSVPELMAQLTSATDRAARAETKVEFLSAQVTELRRRLAEAESGPPVTDEVMPESWEAPEPAPEPEPEPEPERQAEPEPVRSAWEPPSAQPAVEPSPGVSIWGPSSVEDTPAPTTSPGTGGWPAPPPAETEASEPVTDLGAATSDPVDDTRFSLGDIWGEPGSEVAAEEPSEAPSTPELPPTAAFPEPEEEEVRWHEPAASGEPPPQPPPPRKANATVPDEGFYGPRRRRWFKRRP